MKIFKNGIDIKWLAVLFIGIVLGIGITSAYPDIGDPDVYFGFIHGDCGNCSNLPAAQVTGNFTQRINFTGTVYATGLTQTSGSDVAICRDATTLEITINTGFTDCSSSIKANKENIMVLDQTEVTPAKFNALKPVEFNFKGENKRRMGLIAEEVAMIYPEVIAYGDNGEIRGIRYNEMIPLLIEKIQQQDNIINQQSILLNKQSDAINKLIVLQANVSSIEAVQTINITKEPTRWYEFWK